MGFFSGIVNAVKSVAQGAVNTATAPVKAAVQIAKGGNVVGSITQAASSSVSGQLGVSAQLLKPVRGVVGYVPFVGDKIVNVTDRANESNSSGQFLSAGESFQQVRDVGQLGAIAYAGAAAVAAGSSATSVAAGAALTDKLANGGRISGSDLSTIGGLGGVEIPEELSSMYNTGKTAADIVKGMTPPSRTPASSAIPGTGPRAGRSSDLDDVIAASSAPPPISPLVIVAVLAGAYLIYKRKVL